MTDIISLANQALLSLGARSYISSLTEASEESNACSTLIPLAFQDLAGRAWWNSLRKSTSLTLLKSAPGTPENPQGTITPYPAIPWLYSYSYPPDALKIRCVVPNIYAQGNGSTTPFSPGIQLAPTVIPGDGEIPFAVAYDTDSSGNPITVILTNLPQANVIYTVNQQNTQIWESDFQKAFVALLASYLVPALSLNLDLAKMKYQEAMQVVAQARVEDANEGYSSQDHTPDWLIARGYWAGRYPNRYAGYDGYLADGWGAYQQGGSGVW